MGVANSKNSGEPTEVKLITESKKMKMPLIVLREELLSKLSLAQQHHFSIFVEYRFWTSYRKSVQSLFEMRKN